VFAAADRDGAATRPATLDLLAPIRGKKSFSSTSGRAGARPAPLRFPWMQQMVDKHGAVKALVPWSPAIYDEGPIRRGGRQFLYGGYTGFQQRRGSERAPWRKRNSVQVMPDVSSPLTIAKGRGHSSCLRDFIPEQQGEYEINLVALARRPERPGGRDNRRR
jgi:hypothetical protein